MLRRIIRRAAVLLGIFAFLPSVATAVTYLLQTPISGDLVPLTLEVVDAPGGDGVDFTISVPVGEGDLLGLFGNVTDEGLASQLLVDDPLNLLTQWQFKANKVSKVGGGNVMAPVKKWDWGLRIGDNGSAGGSVESASFGLRAPGLDVATIVEGVNQGWVFGVRIQSTTGGQGSSKMGLGEGDPPVGPGPPAITIDQPPDGTITNQSPVTILGTTTGDLLVVDVNGVVASQATDSYTIDLPLVEGANAVVATATNAGGTASAQIGVVLDTIPPQVSITSPADGALTSLNLVIVQGVVSDVNPIASFQINGQDVPLDNGSFQTTLALPLDQLTEIIAVAVDAAGNAGTASAAITHGFPPTLTIDRPTAGSTTTEDSVVVSGTVTGSGLLAVTVNGVVATVTGSSFSATVPLLLGNNEIVATAVNLFGQASESVEIVRGEAPAVQILSPTEGALTSATPISVSGLVTGDPEPSVVVEGVAATVSAGSFEATVPLVEGQNVLSSTATNVFGEAMSSVSVTLDTTPPLVLIGQPADGSELDASSITVSGGVVDASPIVGLTLNGLSITPGSDFSESLDLVEGENTIVVTATDAVGLDGSATVSVMRIVADPLTLSIDTPSDGALFSSSTIEVAGSVSDPTAFVEVNGVVATVTGSQWIAASVPLNVEGVNPIVAGATRGSDTATDQVSVVFNAPPVVEILSPLPGAVVSNPAADVEGVVDDVTALVSVNGVVASVDSGGRFVAEGVPLVVGTNPVVARAVDPLGASGRDEVDVTRDDNVLGEIRIVMLDPLRFPFSLPGMPIPGVPVVADDLASYEWELEQRLSLDPALMSPRLTRVSQPTNGREFDPIYIYVFIAEGEIGGEVTLAEFNPNIFIEPRMGVLQPIGDLAADAQLLNLDSATVDRLVPTDIDPNGFVRFEVPVACFFEDE